MLIFKRILANAVDIFIFFFIFIVGLLYINPFFVNLLGDDEINGTIAAFISLAIVLLIASSVQFLFMSNNQTIGKALFGLRVYSTDPKRPLTLTTMFQREFLGKIMSCYLLALPSLIGNPGQHEIMSSTEVR